ncbi:RidA family protein [Histidinibacterium lentulum]|uniref:RidA family protein n=1 Tax=Histidinibacterium lentulum TaxID=2480588 RepID=A0A3N2R0M6_9RHOB|nr:RidA family protein [Histidinibacterium lentulum]ROU01024.1 RidA family protein [Histidinibacterium lentulum]
MTDDAIEARLRDLGHTLPEATAPLASYVPYVLAGDLLHVSGQIAMADGKVITGRLGETIGVEEAARAAEHCALMLLAQVRAATGSLARIDRVVKLTGFVASASDFFDQPKVVNGGSNLMVAALGPEVGSHARSSVGVAALPLGAAVEIEGIFRIA